MSSSDTTSTIPECQETAESVPHEADHNLEIAGAAASGDACDTVTPKPACKQKIDIFLKATGNAPIMKKKKWAVEPDREIGKIIDFIRQYLKLDARESLFLYINQAFAPAPDQTIRNLYECFGTDGKLVLHYCKSPAWG